MTRGLQAWLGLALLLAACGGEAPGTGERDRAEAGARGAFADASLVIISLDTLRADAVSSYGAPPELSPVLTEFARSAVVFEHARTAAPETAPSHMSLFTSLYPSVHGVQNLSAGEAVTVLRPDVPTLAEALSAAGFETAALTDGGQLTRAPGFGRGFDAYEFELEGAAAKVARAEALLAAQADLPPARRFLFWHTYEVHAPYAPPPEYIAAWAPDDYHGPLRPLIDGLAGLDFAQKWERLKTSFWKQVADFGPDEARYLHGLYRGGVSFADDELAGLFAALEQSGAYDDAIIVVLSDHGEEFAEHGAYQHKQLYEECLRVPLMIRLPGGQGGGRRVATPISLLDLMPTLLELLDVPLPAADGPAPQGRSWATTLAGGPEPDERLLVSEFRWELPGQPSPDWLVAQHYRGWKFIHDGYRGERQGKLLQELYDLEADPGERDDLAAARPERLATFQEQLERFKLGVRAATEGVSSMGAEVDAATLEELRRLGYVR